MAHTIPLLFAVLLSTILAWVKLTSLAQDRREKAAIVAQHGCLPIKKIIGGNLPFGIDLVMGIVRAIADSHLMSFFAGFIDEKEPTLELRMLGNAGLVTTDPENIKSVLSKSKLHDGELDWVFGQRRDALMPLFGDGIFTQVGMPWKHSRELMRKQFARIQYNNLDIFTEHVELLVDRLCNIKDEVVDLQPFFFNFTLDTTTSLLFGECAGSLREGDQDELGANLNKASWYGAIRIILAYLYWLCCLPQFYRSCDVVRDYTDRWVKKALDGTDETDEKSSQYQFIRSLYDELGNRQKVREQLVNVLLAGRDTTACLLSWTFRVLVRHPRVFAKLRAEIDSVLGGDTIITKAKLQQLPYLKNIMTETLRLYTPVPVNLREAGKHTVLPRGGGADGLSPILVPKGMGIGFTPYLMHRREDLYGKDALEFRPERWEDGTLHDSVGWAYLPFNGGPRICLGLEFALLEASYAVIRIVQTFPDLTLPSDEEIQAVGEERQTVTLTMAPTDGCRVQLRV